MAVSLGSGAAYPRGSCRLTRPPRADSLTFKNRSVSKNWLPRSLRFGSSIRASLPHVTSTLEMFHTFLQEISGFSIKMLLYVFGMWMNYFVYQYAAESERYELKGYLPYVFEWSELQASCQIHGKAPTTIFKWTLTQRNKNTQIFWSELIFYKHFGQSLGCLGLAILESHRIQAS